ncbi:hypothetical protein PF005_g28528 [Phytophthora fragariae]|uniref:Uncharacterized protein n=1 Tax=Phytophthora fragariae TaxID=53985 RepID=A0A6A3HG58_9STRA|nr:hypothetical protein PF003_g30779 [Phytophthora fragariae]KAE8920691.1 hypothetical protein PF009_g29020 [Phytophthora fragariae]KAE8967623.1 hypothetical protein PF011_g27489 [Phytophthora fragariae]KAE9065712.1 hypothetical protein PF010_g28089 [Phytophthora fragariae]KAE9066439.1 hypothetical protein PF007_g28469 [Phytophthora fragariae]
MMFWNKLNEPHWPKYVPERYYLAAEALLDEMEEQKVKPLFWGGLSAIGDVEEELPPEDVEPEQDDKSKDADWNAADEGVPVEDVSEVESVSESVTTSNRRNVEALRLQALTNRQRNDHEVAVAHYWLKRTTPS